MSPNCSKACVPVGVLLAAVLMMVNALLESVSASEASDEKVFHWWQHDARDGAPPEESYEMSVYPLPNGEGSGANLSLYGSYTKDLPFSSQGYRYLQSGDVVPMLGKLYHVVEFDPGGPRRMTLREFEPDRLPCWARLNPANLAIADGGSITFRGGPLDVEKLSVIVDGIQSGEPTKRTPTARILIRSFGPMASVDYSQVLVGDTLKANDAGLIVRSIVPPIPKHGVVGWVEIDPTPIKLDEVEDDTDAARSPNDEARRRRVWNPVSDLRQSRRLPM